MNRMAAQSSGAVRADHIWKKAGKMPKKKTARAREPGAPKRERRKRQNQSFRNCPALVWFRSVALVRATLAVSPGLLSKTFIAAAYYWQVDPARLDEIEKARRRYEKKSQRWRDKYLRAYSELLRDKRISFKRVVESARKTPVISVVGDLSI